MKKKTTLFSFKVRRIRLEFEHEGMELRGPDGVARFLMRFTKEFDREHFFAFYLDPGLRLVGFETVAVGTSTSVQVHPKEVFRGALLAGADSVIVAHNHPSGNPHPSKEDLELAEDLVRAGLVVDIPVQDSIIVAHGGAYSIASGHSILL